MKTPRKKRKQQVARTPAEVVKYKKRFIAELAKGYSPGAAADRIKLAVRTAYNWKKDDSEFSTAWIEAVETSLDKLESKVYQSGMRGNVSNAQFTLKYRRYGGGGDHGPAKQSNFILNITLQEHYKRLERLGLPVPQIETDYEEEDASTDTSNASVRTSHLQ
jgi:hypothetical protein